MHLFAFLEQDSQSVTAAVASSNNILLSKTLRPDPSGEALGEKFAISCEGNDQLFHQFCALMSASNWHGFNMQLG